MFNPLWRFGRTTSLILPHTDDFFDVTDHDGTKRPYTNDDYYTAHYRDPQVILKNRPRQILEICGTPWAVCFGSSAKKGRKFKVYYTRTKFYNTSMKQHAIDVEREVLNTLQPYILVPSSKFIELDNAFDLLKEQMASEKAKEALKDL